MVVDWEGEMVCIDWGREAGGVMIETRDEDAVGDLSASTRVRLSVEVLGVIKADRRLEVL